MKLSPRLLTLTSFMLMFALAGPCARADTLFHDDFNSFALGGIWQQTNSTATLSTSILQDGSRTVLNMQSSGGMGNGDGNTGAQIQTTISTPASQEGDLHLTVVFEPLAGQKEPLEVGFWGAKGVTRFFTWPIHGNWASDGTGNAGYVAFSESGSLSNGIYYRGSIDVTSTGTTTTIALDSNPSTIVYSRTFPTITRDLFGDSTSIYLRQGCYPPGNIQEVNVDYVNLDATPVPEPATAVVFGFFIPVFLAKRKQNKC